MKKSHIFLGLLVIMLCGCHTFKLTTQNFQPKGKKLAVISGLENDTNMMLAHYMSEAFVQYSTFDIIPQERIAKLVKGYPNDIKGPYSSAYMEIDFDFSLTDVEQLRRIQKKLGADYLYVLWSPITISHNNGTNYTIPVATQLYEFPDGEEVGRGKFNCAARRVVMGYRGATEKELENGIKYATQKVAYETAVTTGMNK